MRETTRRGVLCALGVTATAGCSSVLGGQKAKEVRAKTVEEISETIHLGKGEFKPYKFSFDTQTVLTYEVVSDKKVDVIVFRRPTFEKYRKNSAKELPHVSELSTLDTNVAVNGANVTAGEPVLVVDNTTWANAQPKENVEASVDVEAFVRPEHADGG